MNEARVRAVIPGLRRGFNEGAGHERVLLYSSLLLLVVMKRYALSLDALLYQEFFLVCILFLALVALTLELWKGGGLAGRNGGTWIWVMGALLLVWSGASVLWSPSPYWGWYWTGSWLGFLVYGGLLSLAFRRESFLGAFLGVVLAGMGMLCVAAIGRYYLSGFAVISWGGVHPLLAAEVLGMFLPLTAGLFFFHPFRMWRGLGLVCFGLFYWTMLLTAKRSPMLGLLAAVLVGGIVLVWLLKRERADLGKDRAAAVLSRPFFRRLGLIVLLAEAMTLVQTRPTVFNGWGINAQNLADRLQPGAIMDPSLQSRFQYWAACGEMFKANPLAGQGAGSFRSGYRHYRGAYFQAHLPWGYFMNDEYLTPTRAHSQYFQVLGELGLVGLVLLGLFLAAVLWTPLRRLAGGRPHAGGASQRRRQLLALCCVLGLVVFCVSAAASSFGFHCVVSAWGFWVLLGLALAWSRPGAGSEAQGPPLQAENYRSQPEGGALGETGDVSPVAPVAAGWRPRNGPGVLWGARMALLAGLGVTAAMGYASFRMVMSDLHYGLFCLSRARATGHLEATLAWQPQNPGPHLLAVKAQLDELLLIRQAIMPYAAQPEAANPGMPSETSSVAGLETQALISRLLKQVRIQDALDHLDLMSRNGLDWSVVHAFKALTAEMVLNRPLALSFLEQALQDGYPDSPFLGAYYLHLSRLLGRDEAKTRERLAFVLRYQPGAFRVWQGYFDDPLAEVEEQMERYPSLRGYLYLFHSFHREIRDERARIEFPIPL